MAEIAPGVTPDAWGAQVAVVAPDATMVEFCLFDVNGNEELARHRLPHRTGALWHGHIPGVAQGDRYGLRAYGPFDAVHRFDPAKLLLDPWARGIDRPFRLHPLLFERGAETAHLVPKAVIIADARTAPPPLRRGPRVIYEAHVRGFTMRNAAIPEALRGTFAALAHPAAIQHLQALGVTHVELMPCAAGIDERHLPALGLTNYWNYNPLALLAPCPKLAPGGMAEIRAAVDALRAAGIGTILDVVLNHTGESDECGPTLSLRGLANAAFHRVRTDGSYANDAGTGNTLALDRPWPLRLAMDALRHWALHAGVEGFRLDLATTLGRRDAGFDPEAPLLSAMRQDPVLRDRLVIAEPWDIGPDGYRLGCFPAGWGEWNDRFRDDVRRFWRGDAGMLGALATRLAGSADVFPRRSLADSVNHVTAHDGFTLADLVSHEHRHNAANGEQGRDGASGNFSWNNGAEGASDDPAIKMRRKADARALLATLLLARGTPMLAMGDECGRTQRGNNNAYAQDNALSWLDWEGMDTALRDFTAGLVRARLAHPALHGGATLTGREVDWHRLDGTRLDEAAWREEQALAMLVQDGDDRILLAVNGGEEAPLKMPPPRRGMLWRLLADSAADAPAGPMAARSVQLHAEEASPGVARATDGPLLRELAATAGIMAEWHDLSGHAHSVPDATLHALLAAMDLPSVTVPQARESLARLRATPPEAVTDHAACHLPERLGRRFGIAVQCYGLRRDGDQGMGDYTAVGDMAREAASAGAMLLGISPPHALPLLDHERASPYQPSDRRFLEPALIDVTALPWDVRDALAAQESIFAALRARATVDHSGVWRAKQAVLRAAWARRPATVPEFEAFRANGGKALRDFCTFNAIAQHHAMADPRQWPAQLHDPDGAGVAAFAERHADAVGFHAFQQWLADTQLAAAARMGAGLYRDLAVGAAPDGAEIWSNPRRYLRGVAIGAPPDQFAPQGQVWGVPAPQPREATATFAELLAANMRHAAALRVDHVMGLTRLFVVPDGARGAEGAYLAYPRRGMLNVLARASKAARCLVVGEDLGTVPPGFRAELAQRQVLSYRVLWFERAGEAFASPREYPSLAAACVATHDLPTLAGWWLGTDLDEREALGLLAEPFAAREARAREREALLAAMQAAGFAPGEPPGPDFIAAVHGFAASAPSALLMVQAEDLAGERVAVNLPGTDRERPNWRRRLPLAPSELLATPLARATLAAVAGRR